MGQAEQSDEDLLVEARRDPSAFGPLYDRHVEELLGFFARRTADAQVAADLAAETFAQAFVSRHRFRSRGEGSARAWMYGIARNQLGRYARRERVSARARSRLGIDRIEVSDGAEARIDDLADLQSIRPLLLEAVRALSTAQLDAVRLRVLDELPYAEVALRLGCSEGAARVRVTRGLSRLAEELHR